MKSFVFILSAMTMTAACQVTGSITGDQPEGPPIKLPPEGKPGGDTAGACGGVTVRGECRDGVAIHCETGSNELRQVDCNALGQECIIDPDRGVSCVDLGLGAPTDPQAACGGLVSDNGYCNPEGQAVWCDTGSDQIYAWNCGQSGLACAVDECQQGAYCCEPGIIPDPNQSGECDRLGFEGECAGETARWCTGSNALIELDCAARGQTCQVDVCASGAYCCTPPEEVNPCPDLGTYGECGGPNGQTVRYCLGDSLNEYACDAGELCEPDVCFNGAECCTQAQYDQACTTMGLDGFCGGPDDNTVVWCTGGTIRREDCAPAGKTCQVDVCDQGAWCC